MAGCVLPLPGRWHPFFLTKEGSGAILRHVSQPDRINPHLRTTHRCWRASLRPPPKSLVSVCFLTNCSSHSSKAQWLEFLTSWPLSLSIRATTGPSINKQDIWLQQHTLQEMKTNETVNRMLPPKLWMGQLVQKPFPELMNTNLIINNLVWTVSSTFTPNPNINNETFKGPCTEAAAVSSPLHIREKGRSQKRIKEILPFAAECMDLESIMLSEVSQAEKDKYHMIWHMWNLINKMN